MKAINNFLKKRYGENIPITKREVEYQVNSKIWEDISYNFKENLPEEVGYYSDNYDEWEPGKNYKSGKLLQYDGVTLQVRQDVTSQAHQPPFSEGMTSIYIPYPFPDKYGIKTYKYGCSTKQNEKFYSENKDVYIYIGVDNPSCIYPPSNELPAIWKKLE